MRSAASASTATRSHAVARLVQPAPSATACANDIARWARRLGEKNRSALWGAADRDGGLLRLARIVDHGCRRVGPLLDAIAGADSAASGAR